uniref:Putative secreted protein n=1 Tax=Anopheles darlingi TaxID=43151 RepID=A0A2M4DCX8_ANODA
MPFTLFRLFRWPILSISLPSTLLSLALFAAMSDVLTVTVDLISCCESFILSKNTLKNDWLRSLLRNLLYMPFWMIGLPPSRSAIPSSIASTKIDGELMDLITSSITRSLAPSLSRWFWTSCSVRPARIRYFAPGPCETLAIGDDAVPPVPPTMAG